MHEKNYKINDTVPKLENFGNNRYNYNDKVLGNFDGIDNPRRIVTDKALFPTNLFRLA